MGEAELEDCLNGVSSDSKKAGHCSGGGGERGAFEKGD